MTRTNRILTMRTLVALLLGLAAMTAWAVAMTQTSHGQEVTFVDDSALAASNRDRWNICVASMVSDVDNQQLKQVVASALTKVAEHPYYAKSGLAAVPPTVSIGCPSTPRITEPDSDWKSGRVGNSMPGTVQPSQYRTFVFVLPTEQLALADGFLRRESPQEYLCQGEVCYEVTTAVYLTEGDLSLPGLVAKEIGESVGLDADSTAPSAPDTLKPGGS